MLLIMADESNGTKNSSLSTSIIIDVNPNLSFIDYLMTTIGGKHVTTNYY